MRFCIRIFSFLIFSLPIISQAATFNVTDSTTFQAALTSAASNGQDNTINLAAGTYVAASTFSFTSLQATALTIVGANAATTIIDGANLVQPLLISNAGNIELDNVTVQNGDSGSNPGGGAAIVNAASGTITVKNSIFNNNTASNNNVGGLYVVCTTCNIVVSNTTVSSNKTSTPTGVVGGVGIVSVSGNVTFSNNTVTNNISAGDDSSSPKVYGCGGFYLRGQVVTFTGNTIQGNQSTFDVGAGHVMASNGVEFTQNTVKQNSATKNLGGVIVHVTGGNANFSNNTIDSNTAQLIAGGFELAGEGSGTITFDSNMITNNISNTSDPNAGVGGGAVAFGGYSGSVTNNLVIGNKAPNSSFGGIYIIDSDGQTINVVNNTVTNNSASGTSGGVALSTNNASDVINYYNNISFGNTGSPGKDIFVSQFAGSTLKLFNNDFSELCFGGGACDPTVLGANQGANINSDPLFVNAAGNDYYLQSSSPALGTGLVTAPGIPSTDFAGNARVVDGKVNMGAFQDPPPTPTPSSGSGGCALNASSEKNVTCFLLFLALGVLPFWKMRKV